MIRSKAVIGLTMLCALLVSAFAAQAANAEGETAHTCVQNATLNVTGTKTFKDAHCKEEASGATGEYKHVKIPNGTVTTISGSDITTGTNHSGAVLKATVAGSAIELVAKEVTGSGTMENTEVGGVMVATGKGKLKYTGVTENLLGCKVTGKPGGEKVVETQELSATTTGEMGLKFSPAGATPFAEFELTGCVIGPITIKVFGSVTGATVGATTNTVHNTVTAAKTLRLQNATTGPVAGIEGTLTIKATSDGTNFFPVASTTTKEF